VIDILSTELRLRRAASGNQSEPNLFFWKASGTVDIFGPERERHLGKSGKIDPA
jgi:hypothetical protein